MRSENNFATNFFLRMMNHIELVWQTWVKTRWWHTFSGIVNQIVHDAFLLDASYSCVHNIAYSDAIILLYNVRLCSTSCKLLLLEQGTLPSSCLSNARTIVQEVATKLCLFISNINPFYLMYNVIQFTWNVKTRYYQIMQTDGQSSSRRILGNCSQTIPSPRE